MCMFIETHDTPNPDTLKFLPGREVSPARTVEFARGDDVTSAPLAEMLFMIPDVARVMMGGDYSMRCASSAFSATYSG